MVKMLLMAKRICLSIMCASASTYNRQGKYANCDGTITYSEFVRDIEAITRISNEIFDNWQLKSVSKIDGTEDCYLTKCETEFIELQNESHSVPCSFVYHIFYHQSYQVPCLGFNAYKQDGSSVLLNDIWNFFRKTNVDLLNKNLTEIITEMDHPVLFTPIFMLHPCRTAQLLTSLPNSANKVVSFLSAMGPSIQLNFDAKYGSN